MLYDVEGLPRVDFIPKTIREIDMLPRELGREFGFRCRNVAAKYLRGSDDDIEESTLHGGSQVDLFTRGQAGVEW